MDDAEANCQQFSDHDVWFEYVAGCTGSVAVDTFGSGQGDTVLSVYDGCGGTEIVCNDDVGGTLSQVTFDATAGQSYRIRLASFGPLGDFDLNASCREAIPTVSEWGLVAMTLLVLTCGTIILRRHRKVAT